MLALFSSSEHGRQMEYRFVTSIARGHYQSESRLSIDPLPWFEIFLNISQYF
jgi:hypothetical protein